MQKFEKLLQNSLVNLQEFGRIYFTPKQLFYECCRNSRFDLKKYFGQVSSFIQKPKTLPTPIAWNEFDEYLTGYLQRNAIESLLKIEPKIDFTVDFPSDLTLYGLPKLLVCEADEIAQMLRANQFHLQTPCAVLSVDEANPLPASFQQMMQRAENPQVYFLHEASLSAYSTLRNLRKTLAFGEEISLRPLGLRPVHAMRLQLFSIQTEPQIFDFSEFTYLSEDEKKWLTDGNLAEVSAVSSVRLMRVLRRLILDLEIPPSNWQITLPKKELGFM